MWLVVLMACVVPDEFEAPAREAERHALTELRFDRWVDPLVLHAGLDEACRFSSPTVANDTTRWVPFQSFWVIHESPDDVEMDRLPDAWSTDDGLGPEDFPSRQGLAPRGFMAPGSWQDRLTRNAVMDLQEEDTLLVVDLEELGLTLWGQTSRVESCELHVRACLWPCEDEGTPIEALDITLSTFAIDSVELVAAREP